MPLRFDSMLARMRGFLLGAGWSAGVLFFWLGSNDAFEGPKIQAALLYGIALAACSWPLILSRISTAWSLRRLFLAVGGALVAATVASWLGALICLPDNLALPLERSVPVLVAAFSALVFSLEDSAGRRRALFLFLGAHCLLLFYGFIQVLDQVAFHVAQVHVDLIQWVRFGENRVYSTLGNPDYMAAHLTLLAAFWLGLGWRKLDPRGPAQAAAVILAVAPLALVPFVYGFGVAGDFLRAMGPWLLSCGFLLVACRTLSARTVWGLLLGLLALLVLLAQGRGAWLAFAVSGAVMASAAFALAGKAFFAERRSFLRWPLAALVCVIAAGGGLLAARKASPQAPWIRTGLPSEILATLDSATWRLTHVFDKANDAQVVRRFYWQSALEMGLAHPLLGVGYGNHAMFTARYQSGVWKRWDAAGDPRASLVEPHVELYTHNDYLQNFAETGALGLLAFLAFWALFFVESWKLAASGAHARDSGRLEQGLGLLGLAAAFSVNAMTNFPWRILATQQLCWLAFAVLAVAARPDEGPSKAAPQQRAGWGGMALGMALAALAATLPLRWFTAGLLFKAGDARKDDPQPAVQVQGIPFYEEAVRAGLSGTQRVELYLYLGSLYNVAQRPDQAEHWFRECVRIYPDFLEAWYNLGYTAQSAYERSHAESDRQAALACYAKVLDIDPRAMNALNNSGNLAYTVGDLATAQSDFERLLKYQSGSLEAHYNLAAVFVRRGDKAQAEGELEKALQIKPDFDPAKKLLETLRALKGPLRAS